MIHASDEPYLHRCVDMARLGLAQGDEPFGSVLVGADGTILGEDHNRVVSGDATQHPEFALARWAGQHMASADRARATVYTSGEHCPMCAAAHAWVGLGRIVYVSSSEQLTAWLQEMEVPPPPVRPLPIQTIAPELPVAGPVPQLAGAVRSLHRQRHGFE